MKVAVISDVHANRQAFEAVLEAVAATDAAELWCLGDLVGYGADPDACVELARRHAAVCLAGNHDLAVTGDLPLGEFTRGASLAAEWTREVMAENNVAFLAEPQPAGPGGCDRALPRQPPGSRLGVRPVGAPCRALLRRPAPSDLPDRPLPRGSGVCARPRGSWPPGEPRRENEELDLSAGEWLLNPGSVGQPRDGDPRAAWMLLDLDSWTSYLQTDRLRHRGSRCSDSRSPPTGLARRAARLRSMMTMPRLPSTLTRLLTALADPTRPHGPRRPGRHARRRGGPAGLLRWQLEHEPDPGPGR